MGKIKPALWIAGAAALAIFSGYELGALKQKTQPVSGPRSSFSAEVPRPDAAPGPGALPAAPAPSRSAERLPSAGGTHAAQYSIVTPESKPALFAMTPRLVEAMMAHGSGASQPHRGDRTDKLPSSGEAPNREVAYVDETQRAPEPESGPPTRLQHYGYAQIGRAHV